MLQCNVILTRFADYICLHGYIHFIYLFNPNTKYRDMYRIPQISPKYRDMNLCSYCPALHGRTVHLVIFCSCGLKREAKSLSFFITEFVPFKFNYNLNLYNILVNFSQFDSPTVKVARRMHSRVSPEDGARS